MLETIEGEAVDQQRPEMSQVTDQQDTTEREDAVFSATNRTPAHFRSALLMRRSGPATASRPWENDTIPMPNQIRPVRSQLHLKWVLTAEGLRMHWSTGGEGGGIQPLTPGLGPRPVARSDVFASLGLHPTARPLAMAS